MGLATRNNRGEVRLGIDPDRLDGDCRDQANQVMRYMNLEADARLAYNQAKSRFELVKAELKLAVNNHPERFDLLKAPTIPIAEAAVIRSARYQSAEAEMHEAKHALDVFRAYVNSLRARGDMISNSVKLEALHYRTERAKYGGNQTIKRLLEETDQITARRPLPTTRRLVVRRKTNHQ